MRVPMSEAPEVVALEGFGEMRLDEGLGAGAPREDPEAPVDEPPDGRLGPEKFEEMELSPENLQEAEPMVVSDERPSTDTDEWHEREFRRTGRWKTVSTKKARAIGAKRRAEAEAAEAAAAAERAERLAEKQKAAVAAETAAAEAGIDLSPEEEDEGSLGHPAEDAEMADGENEPDLSPEEEVDYSASPGQGAPTEEDAMEGSEPPGGSQPCVVPPESGGPAGAASQAAKTDLGGAEGPAEADDQAAPAGDEDTVVSPLLTGAQVRSMIEKVVLDDKKKTQYLRLLRLTHPKVWTKLVQEDASEDEIRASLLGAGVSYATGDSDEESIRDYEKRPGQDSVGQAGVLLVSTRAEP